MLHRLLGTKRDTLLLQLVLSSSLLCAIIPCGNGILLQLVSLIFYVPALLFCGLLRYSVLPWDGSSAIHRCSIKTHDTRLVLSASVNICAICHWSHVGSLRCGIFISACDLVAMYLWLMFLRPRLINDWFDQRTFMVSALRSPVALWLIVF